MVKTDLAYVLTFRCGPSRSTHWSDLAVDLTAFISKLTVSHNLSYNLSIGCLKAHLITLAIFVGITNLYRLNYLCHNDVHITGSMVGIRVCNDLFLGVFTFQQMLH